MGNIQCEAKPSVAPLHKLQERTGVVNLHFTAPTMITAAGAEVQTLSSLQTPGLAGGSKKSGMKLRRVVLRG